MAETVNQESAILEKHAGSSAHNEIFDFFGLPPELRNMVYSYLTEEVTFDADAFGEPDGIQVTLQQKILSKPLLLSRQFKDEYETEMRARQVLVFKDVGNTPEYERLPALFNRTTTSKIQLGVVCPGQGARCSCNEDIETSVGWIQRQLAEIKCLKAVKIELHPCLAQDITTEWAEHAPGATAAFEDVVQAPVNLGIELYPHKAFKPENLIMAYDDRRPPLMKWTRSEGWKECAAGDG